MSDDEENRHPNSNKRRKTARSDEFTVKQLEFAEKNSQWESEYKHLRKENLGEEHPLHGLLLNWDSFSPGDFSEEGHVEPLDTCPLQIPEEFDHSEYTVKKFLQVMDHNWLNSQERFHNGTPVFTVVVRNDGTQLDRILKVLLVLADKINSMTDYSGCCLKSENTLFVTDSSARKSTITNVKTRLNTEHLPSLSDIDEFELINVGDFAYMNTLKETGETHWTSENICTVLLHVVPFETEEHYDESSDTNVEASRGTCWVGSLYCPENVSIVHLFEKLLSEKRGHTEKEMTQLRGMLNEILLHQAKLTQMNYNHDSVADPSKMMRSPSSIYHPLICCNHSMVSLKVALSILSEVTTNHEVALQYTKVWGVPMYKTAHDYRRLATIISNRQSQCIKWLLSFNYYLENAKEDTRPLDNRYCYCPQIFPNWIGEWETLTLEKRQLYGHYSYPMTLKFCNLGETIDMNSIFDVPLAVQVLINEFFQQSKFINSDTYLKICCPNPEIKVCNGWVHYEYYQKTEQHEWKKLMPGSYSHMLTGFNESLIQDVKMQHITVAQAQEEQRNFLGKQFNFFAMICENGGFRSTAMQGSLKTVKDLWDHEKRLEWTAMFEEITNKYNEKPLKTPIDVLMSRDRLNGAVSILNHYAAMTNGNINLFSELLTTLIASHAPPAPSAKNTYENIMCPIFVVTANANCRLKNKDNSYSYTTFKDNTTGLNTVVLNLLSKLLLLPKNVCNWEDDYNQDVYEWKRGTKATTESQCGLKIWDDGEIHTPIDPDFMDRKIQASELRKLTADEANMLIKEIHRGGQNISIVKSNDLKNQKRVNTTQYKIKFVKWQVFASNAGACNEHEREAIHTLLTGGCVKISISRPVDTNQEIINDVNDMKQELFKKAVRFLSDENEKRAFVAGLMLPLQFTIIFNHCNFYKFCDSNIAEGVQEVLDWSLMILEKMWRFVFNASDAKSISRVFDGQKNRHVNDCHTDLAMSIMNDPKTTSLKQAFAAMATASQVHALRLAYIPSVIYSSCCLLIDAQLSIAVQIVVHQLKVPIVPLKSLLTILSGEQCDNDTFVLIQNWLTNLLMENNFIPAQRNMERLDVYVSTPAKSQTDPSPLTNNTAMRLQNFESSRNVINSIADFIKDKTNYAKWFDIGLGLPSSMSDYYAEIIKSFCNNTLNLPLMIKGNNIFDFRMFMAAFHINLPSNFSVADEDQSWSLKTAKTFYYKMDENSIPITGFAVYPPSILFLASLFLHGTKEEWNMAPVHNAAKQITDYALSLAPSSIVVGDPDKFFCKGFDSNEEKTEAKVYTRTWKPRIGFVRDDQSKIIWSQKKPSTLGLTVNGYIMEECLPFLGHIEEAKRFGTGIEFFDASLTPFSPEVQKFQTYCLFTVGEVDTENESVIVRIGSMMMGYTYQNEDKVSKIVKDETTCVFNILEIMLNGFENLSDLYDRNKIIERLDDYLTNLTNGDILKQVENMNVPIDKWWKACQKAKTMPYFTITCTNRLVHIPCSNSVSVVVPVERDENDEQISLLNHSNLTYKLANEAEINFFNLQPLSHGTDLYLKTSDSSLQCYRYDNDIEFVLCKSYQTYLVDSEDETKAFVMIRVVKNNTSKNEIINCHCENLFVIIESENFATEVR
jgi:hypothetical protein